MLFDEGKVMEEMELEWAWMYQAQDKWRKNRSLSDSQIFTLALPVALAKVGESC